MTAFTYDYPPSGDIDTDSPVNQPLMDKLRQNPAAIVEGASGAPRILSQAMGLAYIGSSGFSLSNAQDVIGNVWDMGVSGYHTFIWWHGPDWTNSTGNVGSAWVRLQGSLDNAAWTTLVESLDGGWTLGNEPEPRFEMKHWDGTSSATAYRYYRLLKGDDSDGVLEGFSYAIGIQGDTTNIGPSV